MFSPEKMASNFLRLRKPYYVEPTINCSSSSDQKLVNLSFGINQKRNQTKKRQAKEHHGRRSCLDSCCWVTGYLCTTWWLLLFLYHCCLPFTVVHDVPKLMSAARLKREGLTGIHPVVLVPGIVTGGLELWEGKPCADGLFRKRLWGGGGFTQLLNRYFEVNFRSNFSFSPTFVLEFELDSYDFTGVNITFGIST